MKPAAALLAGTRDATKLLGVEAEVGTLAAGEPADIVAVPGNVVSDIHATEPLSVMHQGSIVVQRNRDLGQLWIEGGGLLQYTSRPAASGLRRGLARVSGCSSAW